MRAEAKGHLSGACKNSDQLNILTYRTSGSNCLVFLQNHCRTASEQNRFASTCRNLQGTAVMQNESVQATIVNVASDRLTIYPDACLLYVECTRKRRTAVHETSSSEV